MSSAIVVHEPWKPLQEAQLKTAYTLFKQLSSAKPTAQYKQVPSHTANPRDTLAESWGVYVRQRFQFYDAVFKEMYPGRAWRALKCKNNYHTEMSTAQPVYTEGEEDVCGWEVDTLIVDFKWEDNSMDMEGYWEPWNWKLSIESNDIEVYNAFIDEESKRCFLHHGDRDTIDFYNMSPAIPATLNCYKRIV